MTVPASYLELELASAKNKDPEELWEDPEWIAEEKLDGWRFALHAGGLLDRPYLTGRKHSKVTGFLAERGANVRCLWPDLDHGSRQLGYTVIDGEILPPIGADYRDLNSIVGKVSPEDALTAIERLGPPQYRVFDALFVDGVDVREQTQIERAAHLRSLFSRVHYPSAEIVPARTDKRALYDEISDELGEGVILKNQLATYGEKNSWIKVKRTVTLDVVVTGFTQARFGATGRIYGQIGAAIIAVRASVTGEMIRVGQVSGMDDATRLDMTQNPGRWIGSVVEVRCARWAKDALWHPRYVRRRDDTEPAGCTFEKMMADLGRIEAKSRESDGQMEMF